MISLLIPRSGENKTCQNTGSQERLLNALLSHPQPCSWLSQRVLRASSRYKDCLLETRSVLFWGGRREKRKESNLIEMITKKYCLEILTFKTQKSPQLCILDPHPYLKGNNEHRFWLSFRILVTTWAGETNFQAFSNPSTKSLYLILNILWFSSILKKFLK